MRLSNRGQIILPKDRHKIYFMKEAYLCAAHAVGICDPNPAVGAVIVDENGRIIGKGFTQPAGFDHAEVMAIKDAAQNHGKESLKNTTLYVTLEPCSHYGRTPPCVDVIVRSKIRTVIIDQIDPTEKSSGKGIQKLNENQIDTVLLEERSLENERFFTLAPFFRRILKGLPMIALKWAQTREGFLSPQRGSSGMISSKEALNLMHRMRHLFRACLATSGAVAADLSRLNIRFTDSLAEEQLEFDNSFFSVLLKRYDLEPMKDNVNNWRYFIIPGLWNQRMLNRFYEIQSAIDHRFHFMISNKDQELTCRKKDISFTLANPRERLEKLLTKITSDGNNQVLIEAGPTMAERLIGSNMANILICLKSKEKELSSGRSFSIARMLAKNETEKIAERGFRLISQIKLKKDEILVFCNLY